MTQLKKKNAANVTTKKMAPPIPVCFSAGPMVMDHSTADSCWCASESAHRRRYEAVCETQLRQNSVHHRSVSDTVEMGWGKKREEKEERDTYR
jgi:hypothetical protein